MMAENQLSVRRREGRYETDLGLIYDMFCKHTSVREVMLSADHLAVRKAASALERVADVLASRLKAYGLTHFRTIPEIRPTTRVRKTPQRFWLEFGLGATQDHSAGHTELFIEFSKTGVTLGRRLPFGGQPIRQDIVRALRPLNTIKPLDANDWCLGHYEPPAGQNACSTDVNDWLAGRYKSRQVSAVPITLSKRCPGSRPTMSELIAGLEEASALIEAAIGERETLGAAMI
ncbi:hypothetical protein [Sulfitobacter guttiformis]|uniref:Uncharacterized protein n=1 Tax=Sulfitobacter guttiformis TaxID=74349 RepID=A0A420DUD6_9RHOB|nr:hypothetical protein [Sulfitobacter guttiformis]KIN71271.1 hypothetical protein Z949_429 [Sulfitobacter guttiformis KCTC 32187]RKE97727.1 hypothetical protein C8N30_2351 [Sulfitobacter guttiformis]